MKKAMFLTMAALMLAVSATGCVGKFAMFNSLAKWNLKMSDSGLVQEVVFLVLWIIPVYQICSLVDVVIFNSMEFWGKTNPGEGIFAFEGKDAQGTAYAVVSNGDGTATLTYKDQAFTLTKADNGFALSQNGIALGTVTKQGSVVTFTGVDGAVQSALR